MKDLSKIYQRSPKGFGDGLMTKTNSEDRFLARIGFYDIKQQACLTWYARTGGEDDFVKWHKVLKLELVIAEHGNFGSKLFYKV